MSSGQKPRTPRYFPRMKVRGARRRRVAPLQLMTGSFDRLSEGVQEVSKSMMKLWEVVKNEQP